MKTRLYTASKLQHAPMWQKLRTDNSHIEFTSRWIDMVSQEAAAKQKDFMRFWLGDHEDVRRSDFVAVYATGDDHLRGALVEAGMGLALGKKIIVIGEHDDYGTWQHHPGVWRVASIEEMLYQVGGLAR